MSYRELTPIGQIYRKPITHFLHLHPTLQVSEMEAYCTFGPVGGPVDLRVLECGQIPAEVEEPYSHSFWMLPFCPCCPCPQCFEVFVGCCCGTWACYGVAKDTQAEGEDGATEPTDRCGRSRTDWCGLTLRCPKSPPKTT